MRKLLCTGFALTLLTLALGSSVRSAEAATTCRYKCSCSGAPLKCCTTDGVESCKPTSDIQCPQVYTC